MNTHSSPYRGSSIRGWIADGLSKPQRRRLLAVLRRAYRILGMKRGWTAGALTSGGRIGSVRLVLFGMASFIASILGTTTAARASEIETSSGTVGLCYYLYSSISATQASNVCDASDITISAVGVNYDVNKRFWRSQDRHRNGRNASDDLFAAWGSSSYYVTLKDGTDSVSGAGGVIISGIAAQALTSGSTYAVNGGQLYSVSTAASTSLSTQAS